MADKKDNEALHIESAGHDNNKSMETWTAEFASRDLAWHQQETRRLLWKIDLHLLPWIVLMYLTNFLDRK